MPSTFAAQLTCPRCGVALAPEIVGELSLHRCGECGGVWLDPATLRAVCEAEVVSRGCVSDPVVTDDVARRPDDRVTYLRCAQCDELMNRVNFARVSGVIIDVCREHGAWFDAGELRAVRRFVRGSGLARAARSRPRERERDQRSLVTGTGRGTDLLDELAGIPDRWDVPSRASTARRLLRAVILAVIGGAMLWGALVSWKTSRGSVALAGLAILVLLAALRALAHAVASRPPQEDGKPRPGRQ